MGLLILILAILLPIEGFPFDPQFGLTVQINKGTRLCLECHDGTLAPNILNNIRGEFRGVTPAAFCLEKGHPVAVDYRLAVTASKGRLRDPALIDPAVKLEDGRVGCTSCHDPNSQLRAKLVMSNSGSRLCFSCHNL